MKLERVSVERCASTSEDAEVIRRTQACIERLGSDWATPLRTARTIVVKINAGVRRADILTDGKQTELTEPAVIEGVVRALRDVTDAELIIGDAPTEGDGNALYTHLGLPERLCPYPKVRIHDFSASEVVETEMRHAGPMFRKYMIPREIVEADAVVSVAKMKAHQSLGCTLCIKNLFGWMPMSVYGSPRTYLHDRLIRLPRVLSDLAQYLRPCLNVVDGIVAANKSEWGGESLRPGVLLAGTNCVATDSVGARIMGFGPNDDYPDHPFLYRRNVIRLAAQAGLGPNSAEDIAVLGPTPEDIMTSFTVHGYDEKTPRSEEVTRRNAQIRRGAECVAWYREQQSELADRYGAGRLLALSPKSVLWDGADMATMQRLEHESGLSWDNGPTLLVRCLPPDQEIEEWDWYAAEASGLPDPTQG